MVKRIVLLGSSGSGKTTLLKMVNGLVQPTSGTVVVNNHNTATMDPIALRRSLGYVFQGIGLFPHLTVGAKRRHRSKASGIPLDRPATSSA